MANEARRTLTQMVTAVRTNLDEATAAFYTDANLYTVLTRAAHAVATEIRKLKADHFMRTQSSTDGSTTVYGETYLPSSLALVAGTTEYTLSPDLVELKLIECITSGYEWVTFVHRDLASPEFRATKATYTTNQPPDTILFDVVGERTLVIAPASDRALDLKVRFISSAVIRATSTDAFLLDFATGTDQLVMPFPGYMAVEEVATMRALLRDRDALASAYASMADATVARLFGSHARQTQDAETVRGLFE